MKLLADQAIPGVVQLLAPHLECLQLPAEQITPATVQDADILLVRSVTPVNAALLADSAVRFVGSGTIGVDHVDQAYLQQRQIAFAHAPGCNAVAVSEYVLSTILRYAKTRQLSLAELNVGVIGWGQVGRALTQRLDILAIAYQVYDPPLQAANSQAIPSQCPSRGWASWSDVINNSNVITLHVPLIKHGLWPTQQLLNQTALTQIQPQSLLINTCRGEVLDEQALFQHFAPEHFYCAVDVFAHEPAIDPRWLCYAWQMTPHIAGHSERGKWRGTEMIYDALKDWLANSANQSISTGAASLPVRPADFAPIPRVASWTNTDEVFSANNPAHLTALIDQVFDLPKTDQQLRHALIQRQSLADAFRQARREYVPRYEFQDIKLVGDKWLKNRILNRLGFITK